MTESVWKNIFPGLSPFRTLYWFGYKKHGKEHVLKKPHDIAHWYRNLRKLSVYWDVEEDELVPNSSDSE
jgi:hypothetical protein